MRNPRHGFHVWHARLIRFRCSHRTFHVLLRTHSITQEEPRRKSREASKKYNL